MRSLYDAGDVPNLRDDLINIIKRGGGGGGSDRSKGNGDGNRPPVAMAAVALECRNSRDAQMRIRDMLEDTPSMTAFSSDRSALRKDGIFFGVRVSGKEDDDDGDHDDYDDDNHDAITPEVRSRASYIL